MWSPVDRSGRVAVWALAAAVCALAACETPSVGEPPRASREPSAPESVPMPAPRPPSKPAAPAAHAKSTRAPAEHVVRPGEDIYAIADRYRIDAYDLAMTNGLAPPFALTTGQRLRMPGASSPPATSAAAAPAPEATSMEHHQTDRPTPPSTSASASPSPSPAVVAPAPARPTPAAPEPMEAVDGFIWPARGDVISGFGPKGAGLYNDGINIAAERGDAIRAVGDGVVLYAGNELRGFGNMLLVRHDGGWTSAYAHAEELLVGKGDHVTQGQVIGKVGSTGAVSRPQLHFELRKGKKPVDPQRYLKRAPASAQL